jgi:hypothetical protein
MDITYILDFLQKYSGALTFLATVLLVALTAFYAYWTKGILAATANQSRLSLNPVIGIKISKISIGTVFGKGRRNMSVSIELSNVGNAPAIEVLVDAEIELRYSKVKNQSVIPGRFEPDMVPYIRPGETVDKISPGFGNTFITHFFDDVRESSRLNLHRIETDPTQEPFKTSKLRIIVYYRNSLAQYFKSYYETEIALWAHKGTEKIPGDEEACEVNQIYIPRPVFHSGVDSEESAKREIDLRNAKRDLSGW